MQNKSAVNVALDVLRAHFSRSKTSMTNSDLKRKVAEVNGQSDDVLHGTLDGTSVGTLRVHPEYAEKYHTRKTNSGRIMHRKGPDDRENDELGFGCWIKAKTNTRIMANLKGLKTPNVLTLASLKGECVKKLFDVCPDAIISSVEMDEDILDKWEIEQKKLGIDCQNYLGRFQDFIRTPDYYEQSWDLVNADVMGYPGTGQSKILTTINETKACRFFALTTQYDPQGNFRNQDGWKWDALYPSGDKKGNFVRDHMSNYKEIDRWHYKGENKRQPMEVFVFEVKA